MSPLRIVYAGTPDFAVPALQALIDSPHEVVAVYTQPDRPSGRGRKITFGPVKQLAVDHDIPVEQPPGLKTEEAQARLRDYRSDVMIVAAYGLILPQAVLDTPTYGCLNIHGSLLPRWRGAAPIQRAIQAGDNETGITIMQMNAGLDTGDMLYKSRLPITDQDTGQSIHDALAIQGAQDLLVVLKQLQSDSLSPESQDDAQASYAHKLDKSEASIDWQQSAIHIDRMIRAFNPWPVAYTSCHGKPLKILSSAVVSGDTSLQAGKVIAESKQGISIATGDGILLVKRLQLPGKKAMNVADFLNGHTLEGVTLG